MHVQSKSRDHLRSSKSQKKSSPEAQGPGGQLTCKLNYCVRLTAVNHKENENFQLYKGYRCMEVDQVGNGSGESIQWKSFLALRQERAIVSVASRQR